MWVKYLKALYNTEDINTIERTYDNGNDCYVIELESHEAHYYDLSSMTKEEVNAAFTAICEALKSRENYLDLDAAIPHYVRLAKAGKEEAERSRKRWEEA